MHNMIMIIIIMVVVGERAPAPGNASRTTALARSPRHAIPNKEGASRSAPSPSLCISESVKVSAIMEAAGFQHLLEHMFGGQFSGSRDSGASRALPASLLP